MSSSSPKSSPRQEPRSWDQPEELDRVIDELRGQIESLRARVEDYRNVVAHETQDDDSPGPDV